MILSVFGDESADETRERVFAVSCVIGTETEWTLAEREWLERTGGKVFHAADCERERDFELYKDLAIILARSYLAGVSVALDLISHREFFPDALDDIAYYKCMTDVMAALTRRAVKFNATDADAMGDAVRLEFTALDQKV
jgi:hypothetical protein